MAPCVVWKIRHHGRFSKNSAHVKRDVLLKQRSCQIQHTGSTVLPSLQTRCVRDFRGNVGCFEDLSERPPKGRALKVSIRSVQTLYQDELTVVRLPGKGYRFWRPLGTI
jgi:hypothetical protein